MRELGARSAGWGGEEEGYGPEGVKRLCLRSFERLALESTHDGLPAWINGDQVRAGLLVGECQRGVEEHAFLLRLRR